MSGIRTFVGVYAEMSALYHLLSHILITQADAILTSKYNKPFPVTLLPSGIAYWLGVKQGERQAQILTEIQALDVHDHQKVKEIAGHPR